MLRRSFMNRCSNKMIETKQDKGGNIKMSPNKAKFSNSMLTRRAGKYFSLLILITSLF